MVLVPTAKAPAKAGAKELSCDSLNLILEFTSLQRKWQHIDDGTIRVFEWRCEDSRLNHGYQSPLYLFRFIFYLKIDDCQNNRKFCQNTGAPEDLVLFEKLQADNHSMQSFSLFAKTAHTTCACEGSTVICWNTSHHWYIWTILAPQYCHRDGARFVLMTFFAYNYLWGVSRQLS